MEHYNIDNQKKNKMITTDQEDRINCNGVHKLISTAIIIIFLDCMVLIVAFTFLSMSVNCFDFLPFLLDKHLI